MKSPAGIQTSVMAVEFVMGERRFSAGNECMLETKKRRSAAYARMLSDGQKVVVIEQNENQIFPGAQLEPARSFVSDFVKNRGG